MYEFCRNPSVRFEPCRADQVPPLAAVRLAAPTVQFDHCEVGELMAKRFAKTLDWAMQQARGEANDSTPWQGAA